jgi:DNA polymerase III sliding clamp (beta) subunit (PCNA family)
MIRKDLVDKLSLVQPALSANELIPILNHVWFTKTHMMTYNDQIAISVPCKTDFAGAAPGSVLIELMRNSKAKDVEFLPVDDELQIKAASSKFKLGLLPAKDFVFEMPKPSNQVMKVNTKEFLECIATCLRSVSADTSVPDQLGVTLIYKPHTLLLCSTNHATMSSAKIKMPTPPPFKDRVILSTPFCEQLLRIAGPSINTSIEIHEDYSLATTAKGVTLFGRLIEVPQPLDFVSLFNHHIPKEYPTKRIPIPTKMRLILERAIIITDSATDQTTTAITVKEGRARFVSKSARGEVIDSMQVGETQHDTTISLNCKHVKAGMGSFDNMLVTEDCLIMSKENSFYLIAAEGG